MHTQASLEEHGLGQRRLSYQSEKDITVLVAATARPKPRPGPLFSTEESQPGQHPYQQRVPPPLQPVPTYTSTSGSPVVTSPPLQQQSGLRMPQYASEVTMEYSEVSPQHNRVSETEPSHHTSLEERMA